MSVHHLLSGTLIVTLLVGSAQACTLWAAAGPDAGEGTLLSKNRDWVPDHVQVLKYEHSEEGYAFFGLYAEGNKDRGLKNGVNEKGLSIVSASASSIPKKIRSHQPGKRGMIRTILSRYASVDELAADAEQIFSSARANFYLIADRDKVMQVEVGLEGRYRIQIISQGTLAHSNHYLAPELGKFNMTIGSSSHTRLARINALLAHTPRPLTVVQFATISRDRNDGPNNSLWRNGRLHTLSSWIIRTPKAGSPTLHVVLANPGEPETHYEYTLNTAFWKSRRNENGHLVGARFRALVASPRGFEPRLSP